MDRFPTPVDRGRGWPRGKGVGWRSWACDPALLRSHRDGRRGLEHFKAAIALDPTLAEVRRALADDPRSASANAEFARALLVNGRCDEGMERLEPLALLDPPLLRVPSLVAQCHAHQGNWPVAITALRRASDPLGPRGHGLLGSMMARGGERENAAVLLGKLREEWEQGEMGAFPVALVHARLGDLEEAFAWLHRAVDDHSLRLGPGDPLLMQPLLEDLRPDPRFNGLRTRLGLPGS